MPKMYEDIRNSYVASGKSYDESQKLAAMTYNKRRQTHPDMPKLSNKPDGETTKVKKIKIKKKAQ